MKLSTRQETNIYFQKYQILRLLSRDMHTLIAENSSRIWRYISLTTKPSDPMSLKSRSTMYVRETACLKFVCVISIYRTFYSVLQIVLLLIVLPITHPTCT